MFAEWGDLTGIPLFSLHGTPNSRLSRHPNENLISSTGARVITYDRPGYGGSDRDRGRSVASCAGDVAAIADALGLESFAVSGGSGGGPHALAVAALLESRVTRAACVVALAPFAALGDRWLEGMDPENVKEIRWALLGEEVLVAHLQREYDAYLQQAAIDPSRVFDRFQLSESDRAVLAREDRNRVELESLKEAARNGLWGWVDDDLAFVRPWGFDPANISRPVQIWFGTSDVFVPPSHGEWLAHNIPGAVVEKNDLGHMGDPDNDLLERYQWLTDDF
jgi:pimeloyl-ACP methyl ester carboxylesterase